MRFSTPPSNDPPSEPRCHRVNDHLPRILYASQDKPVSQCSSLASHITKIRFRKNKSNNAGYMSQKPVLLGHGFVIDGKSGTPCFKKSCRCDMCRSLAPIDLAVYKALPNGVTDPALS